LIFPGNKESETTAATAHEEVEVHYYLSVCAHTTATGFQSHFNTGMLYTELLLSLPQLGSMKGTFHGDNKS
jgi:hypothetical protein